MIHVGIGYDVHPLLEGRKLILGGVEIPHSKGLDGHSDADALAHAITDAVLGAIGEVDIGHFFPNTDPAYRNIDSQVLLQRVCAEITKLGYNISNLDASVIAEKPKIFPRLAEMKAALARSTGLLPDEIGLKATTNEGVGDIGRGLAIAAHAVCLLSRS